MRKVRSSLLCALLLSSSAIGAAWSFDGKAMITEGKTNPLCLRGKVTDVALVKEDKHSIVFSLKLRLEFVNTSNKPVIMLQREFWLGAKTLASSPENAAAYKYLYTSSSWASVSTAPEWKELRQRLDQPSPPSDLTRTLAPGESLPYEAGVTLYIEKAGSFDKTSQRWDVIKQASPVWLQVTLETWAINIEPRVDPDNLEFGKMLRQRWQQFGELELGRLTSEPMLLDFSTLCLPDTARQRK